MKSDDQRTENYDVEIVRDMSTRVAIAETWRKGITLHREGGPAHVRRDATTGTVIEEGWWIDGHLQREDGPAYLRRKADTGRVCFSEWFRNGIKIAPPRPVGKTGRRNDAPAP